MATKLGELQFFKTTAKGRFVGTQEQIGFEFQAVPFAGNIPSGLTQVSREQFIAGQERALSFGSLNPELQKQLESVRGQTGQFAPGAIAPGFEKFLPGAPTPSEQFFTPEEKARVEAEKTGIFSFQNIERQRLAGQTQAVQTSLGATSQFQGGDLQTVSIVDFLSSVNQPSDFQSRTQLAQQFGIQNYTGTAEQNTQLLGILRSQGGQVAPPIQPPITGQPGVSGGVIGGVVGGVAGGQTGASAGQQDIQSQLQAIQETLTSALTPSAKEQAIQELLDKVLSGGRLGIQQVQEQAIATPFITGQSAAIERRALAQAEPLERQLGRLQAQRRASLDVAKTQLGFEESRLDRLATQVKTEAKAGEVKFETRTVGGRSIRFGFDKEGNIVSRTDLGVAGTTKTGATLSISEAETLGLPKSLVGRSEQQIFSDLQQTAPIQWFLDWINLMETTDRVISPQEAQARWEEFRRKILTEGGTTGGGTTQSDRSVD